MKTIVLISCGAKKRDKPSPAKDLYLSPLFKNSLAYAHYLKPDKIFILSALHHLLELDRVIEPYNVTLSNIPKSKRKEGLKVLSPQEKKEWGKRVVEQLSKHADLKNDQFIILAGQEYIKPLTPFIENIDNRLKGLPLGERVKYLKKTVPMSDIVFELHKIFNNLKRYYFPFHDFKNEIPQNGIYVLFEKGEKYKQLDRIVRIGTHTGDNQLYSRLKQHYIKENKNRSIFRKNIGRCFLNKENNPYLEIWNLDTTPKENKELYSNIVDVEYEKQIEKQITEYIQSHFSFVVFPVKAKISRLYWESKIASTIAQSIEIEPSPNWLGLNSPKEKIRESGLWQVNGLGGDRINELELIELSKLLVT